MAACQACPRATGCLKWALANPQLTPTGVWAATTARQRTVVRVSLENRLGLDWVGVVAARDHARKQHRPAAGLHPPTVAEQEPTPHPKWGNPYEPWREPLTPERQQRNQQLLALDDPIHRTLAEAS